MTSRIRTTGVKSYPSYKDCGAPWIREIPEHWKTTAVKREYEIQMGKMLQPYPQANGDVAVPYLKALNVQWYSVHADNPQTMWATQEEIEQLEVAPGDLLVCEGGEGGRAGIVKSAPKGLIIQNALHRVRSRGRSQNQFLQHLLRVVSDSGWFEAINSKATIAHFTKEKFAALPIPIPPAEEQASIVRFLDHADEQIQRYIAGKERLIALLEEERQALVHQAVTRGLDPSVRLRPSGVERLGDVPEHWEIRRLRTIAEMRVSNVDKHTKEGEIPVRLCNYTDVYKNAVIDQSLEFMPATAAPEEAERFRIREQDVLITKDSETWDDIGVPSLVKESAEDLICGYHLAILRPRAGTTGEFLNLALQARTARIQFSNQARGVTRYGLTHNGILSVIVPLPPSREQETIVNHLTESMAEMDDITARSRRQIDLMNEYRTRLIADVVTGQIDVRKAMQN